MLSLVTDEMFTGKDQPEDEQVGIEDALLDIVEEVDPGHVVSQGEVLQGQIEEGERQAQGQEALLQQVRAARQQPDPAPEPPDLHQDDREEDRLQRDPDLGEAAVLVDGDEPDVDKFAKCFVDLVDLSFAVQVNGGNPKQNPS